MPRYEVKRTLIVEANVTLIVEAESPDDAADAVSSLVPSNIGTQFRNAGWSASIKVKPRKGVTLKSDTLRANWIDHSDPTRGAEPKLIKD